MKFVLFVEGKLEKEVLPDFLHRWLDTRLPQRVRIAPVRFEGWRDYYKEIGKKVSLSLTGRSGQDVIAGIGLLDLYGPTFYPDDKTTAAERIAWAKTHLEGRVSHPRFRQHFAVHETEAWLLADPANLPVEVRNTLPGRTDQPETVNFNEPPARLLERLYLSGTSKAYRKVIHGSNLFQALDPEVAAQKCPNLRLLLEDMLRLAQAAIA